MTRTRLKVAEGAPGFSLLEAEFVNHRYEPHFHDELVRFQLVRLFNRQVGMPPHAFLVQLRLAKACQLLRAGTSIAASAADSGFFDQSALTRHFRRSLGVTPRQYREAARGQAGDSSCPGWFEVISNQ